MVAVGDHPGEDVEPAGRALRVGLRPHVLGQRQLLDQRHQVGAVALQHGAVAQVDPLEGQPLDLLLDRRVDVGQEGAAQRPGEVAEAQVDAGRLHRLGADPVVAGADPLLGNCATQLLRRQHPGGRRDSLGVGDGGTASRCDRFAHRPRFSLRPDGARFGKRRNNRHLAGKPWIQRESDVRSCCPAQACCLVARVTTKGLFMNEETSLSGWWVFAGILLAIAGVLNIVYGIAAIDNSKFFTQDATYIVSSLHTWGWVTLIIGVLELIAAFSLWSGGEFGRWFGILMASLNSIGALLSIPAYPFWSLAVFALCIIVIYKLAEGPQGSGLPELTPQHVG